AAHALRWARRSVSQGRPARWGLPRRETAPLEERGDVGVAAAQLAVAAQRVGAVPPGEEGFPEPPARRAADRAVPVPRGVGAEPLDRVRVEHLAPDVGVVAGVVAPAEGVVEVRRAVARRDERVGDARLRQCPPVELLDRVRVRRYLLRRQLVPRLVEQGGAEVLRGGEALPVLGRAEQRLAQLLGQRLTGAVVARIAR